MSEFRELFKEIYRPIWGEIREGIESINTDEYGGWLSPDGKFNRVVSSDHVEWAKRNLLPKLNAPKEYYKDGIDVYGFLYDRGWVRVGIVQDEMDIVHSRRRELSRVQLSALKDLSMELKVKTIHDLTSKRRIKVDQSKILKEMFHNNAKWFVYEGEEAVTVVFENNKRHTIKINFRNNRLREDRQKWLSAAARKWKSIATEIYKESMSYSPGGNIIQKNWEECFKEALQDPRLKEYINDGSYSPIFESYMVNELTYRDLVKDMDKYSIRHNGGLQQVGDNGRWERSKHVRVRPLRVTSTIGKDGEKETSLFSYKSEKDWGNPGDRYHGHIRFLGESEDGLDAEIEVGCSCPDYRYVWAKPNADAGAGHVGADQIKGTVDNHNNGQAANIRNPKNVPGLCKHLMALSEYLNTNVSKPLSTPSAQPQKPINIFEEVKNFARNNPSFTVQYED